MCFGPTHAAAMTAAAAKRSAAATADTAARAAVHYRGAGLSDGLLAATCSRCGSSPAAGRALMASLLPSG